MTPDEMNLETQCGHILQHMKTGKAITGLEALRRYGCIHLPRRILDLKERGFAIADQWIRLPNGKRCKEYWLDG